jgi:hypothetical protein
LSTDFIKYFTDNRDFQSYVNRSNYVDTINVLYQDNSTIALKSHYMDSIWKAVSIVKKDGYKIDGITSFTETNLSTNNNTANLLVVMSK